MNSLLELLNKHNVHICENDEDTIVEVEKELLAQLFQPSGSVGIALIAKEREEQITKHHRTVELDVLRNSTFELPLTKAANALSLAHISTTAFLFMKPMGWSQEIWEKMLKKPYEERLAIAGALIAAEIDRIAAINKKQAGK